MIVQAYVFSDRFVKVLAQTVKPITQVEAQRETLLRTGWFTFLMLCQQNELIDVQRNLEAVTTDVANVESFLVSLQNHLKELSRGLVVLTDEESQQGKENIRRRLQIWWPMCQLIIASVCIESRSTRISIEYSLEHNFKRTHVDSKFIMIYIGSCYVQLVTNMVD